MKPSEVFTMRDTHEQEVYEPRDYNVASRIYLSVIFDYIE